MVALYRHATFALAACLAAAPCLSRGLPRGAPAGAAQEAQAPPPTGAVGPAQGRRLIRDLGKDLVVLDVRTPSEYGQGHIPGAINVPVADVDGRMGDIPADRPTLIVCKAGGRAARAYRALVEARPGMAGKGLWYLDAAAEYGKDGAYTFTAAPR